MDFDERYRADVMRYAAERYGSDRVAQVITFSTIKARAAVRDAARVLGKPYALGDRIAKAMPPLIMGRDTPLRACLARAEGHEDGYATAGESAPDARGRSRGERSDRRRPGPRGAASPGRDPCGRGGDLEGPVDGLPPSSAQAGRRRRPGGRAHRHPVRNAWRRGPWPVEDGLSRAAQPFGDRTEPRPH